MCGCEMKFDETIFKRIKNNNNKEGQDVYRKINEINKAN